MCDVERESCFRGLRGHQCVRRSNRRAEATAEAEEKGREDVEGERSFVLSFVRFVGPLLSGRSPSKKEARIEKRRKKRQSQSVSSRNSVGHSNKEKKKLTFKEKKKVLLLCCDKIEEKVLTQSLSSCMNKINKVR